MHAQGTPQFDVLAANTAEIERYTRANLLAPLDLASLPNTRKQLPRIRALSSIKGLTSAGNVYAIPFTYSSMGLIYDRKQIAVAPRSMRELWNPRYRGKVLDFNSAQHNFSFTALALGYPHPFQLDATQMRVIAHKLVDLRRNLLTYCTLPEEATAFFSQGLANTLTAPAESSDKAHIVWIGPVEDIQRREELWNRIVSGDRSERF